MIFFTGDIHGNVNGVADFINKVAPACITTLLKIIMGKISDGCGGAWREMKQALEDALTKENREEHTETR